MVHKKIIITGFVAAQLIIIFFYIYTQSIIIKLTYSFQDQDRIFQELQKRKKDLTQELLKAQDAQKLKTHATQELQMKKARLSDIKELPPLDSATLTISQAPG